MATNIESLWNCYRDCAGIEGCFYVWHCFIWRFGRYVYADADNSILAGIPRSTTTTKMRRVGKDGHESWNYALEAVEEEVWEFWWCLVNAFCRSISHH